MLLPSGRVSAELLPPDEESQVKNVPFDGYTIKQGAKVICIEALAQRSTLPWFITDAFLTMHVATIQLLMTQALINSKRPQ